MRGFCCVVCAVVFLFFGMAAARGGETWYLRVVARDDTAAAQEEKIRVRDAVLAVCPPKLQDLPAAMEHVRRAAEDIAPCTVDIREWSPGRGMPAAPTLYITIDQGRGRNWWGVLYRDAALWARADGGDALGEDDKIVFVWPVWEWIMGLLGG